MRTLIISAVAFIVLIGTPAWSYVIDRNVNSYSVHVRIGEGPPVLGQNVITLTITDASSRPVSDAAVAIRYFMPSLPGRPPMMEYTTTAKREDGAYRAELDLRMKGEWVVALTIARQGETETVKFGFHVS